ncbi:hypothetical protein B7494_g7987 [Chlorociboria aeruginascens]|nr:hypothetical protein B7494_g7987 [Chlorociboria aeruginascens]
MPKPGSATLSGKGSGLKIQQGGDRSTQQWQGIPLKKYPSDCPQLNARWFYAVDVPKRKPKLLKNNQEDTKPPAPPKKFVSFSAHDSRSIEAAYQKLVDEYEDAAEVTRHKDGTGTNGISPLNSDKKPNTSISEAGSNEDAGGRIRVPVHEDFLFDVDIEKRELCPVYWLGPIYEVRRGSWFYQEGSSLRPCDEPLATQLEEGYLKVKPFRYPRPPTKAAGSTSVKSVESVGSSVRGGSRSGEVTPKASIQNLKTTNQQTPDGGDKETPIAPHQPQTYRLFGAYMNSIVTYQDSNTAWLSTDNIMSQVSSTIYKRFAGDGYFGGVKIVRGYSDSNKSPVPIPSEKASTPKNTTDSSSETSSYMQLDERQQKLLKRRSAPASTSPSQESPAENISGMKEPAGSSINNPIDVDMDTDAIRDEKEIQNDYNDREGENQGRPIEHVILVTHGIGQKLGMRTESVNFIHDVNVLRQTIKSVYRSSPDLQSLNSEVEKLPKNCRIQVLPVVWRHLLDFPRKAKNRKERDLGDALGEEEEYPSLEDLQIEGVPFVRSLITDLALDILLYQSAYREDIMRIVITESNRIFNLFRARNPSFRGKVSLIGHSLGSAVLFDILCREKDVPKVDRPNTDQMQKKRSPFPSKPNNFEFDVEDFYCLGSPIGLFQILKGRSRNHPESFPSQSPLDIEAMQDPFLAASPSFPSGENISSSTGLPVTVSSPKCSQLYNIFHPTDPIAYRLEPLITPAMKTLKPQRLTGEDIQRMEVPSPQQAQSRGTSQPIGAGTNISSGGVITDVPTLQRENTSEKMRKLAEDTAAADRDGRGMNAPTLIDDEIETLYSGFRRETHKGDEDTESSWAQTEERGKKIRREEMKVRALNHNSRVDFSIQESVLDFNPIK